MQLIFIHLYFCNCASNLNHLISLFLFLNYRKESVEVHYFTFGLKVPTNALLNNFEPVLLSVCYALFIVYLY